jgi:hypothetical protein
MHLTYPIRNSNLHFFRAKTRQNRKSPFSAFFISQKKTLEIETVGNLFCFNFLLFKKSPFLSVSILPFYLLHSLTELKKRNFKIWTLHLAKLKIVGIQWEKIAFCYSWSLRLRLAKRHEITKIVLIKWYFTSFDILFSAYFVTLEISSF